MPVIINPEIINGEIIVPGLDQWPGCNIELLLVATIIFITAFILKERIETQSENE